MPLITLKEACVSTGNYLLIDHVNFAIEPRERIALIGRNGAGKSTLMKLINKEIMPDDGEVVYQSNMKVARLEQEVPRTTQGTIFSVIAEGLGIEGVHLAEYLDLSARIEALSDKQQDYLHNLHVDWSLQAKIDKTLSELSLDGNADFAALSGGMKRRVLLGRALVQDPDLLLLDEPTNHLDIDAILWLEKFLLNYQAALLFITHDRALLQKLATRIVELDRGNLTSFPGDYQTYQTQKAAMLEVEATHNALFDKKLAQEEVWIRQGIKARRVRNEGRVTALKKLREERSQRREVIGNVSLDASMADRSGQMVLEAKQISHRFAGAPLVKDFSITVHRGDKIGIIGPNGAGKTTLLNLLLGKLTPESGSVRLGQNLQIAYFDQLREALDPEASVADNVMEGSTTIEINGNKKHIIGYLQDFLFTPDRARSPTRVLSGGERNRLLLAKLFAKPSNVLIMDEPTNDLDAETLDLLEEMLIDYPGTIIMVSHDRAFLNAVATSTIAFEGQGQIFEYVGGYDDWVRQRRNPVLEKNAATQSTSKPASPQKNDKKSKLSFTEQHELKEIEQRIIAIEKEQKALQAQIADAPFYALSVPEQQKVFAKVKTLDDELEQVLARWEILEAKRA
jgi:ATP-binding cassette subfamily F protein uup